jgi:hypothetical protein
MAAAQPPRMVAASLGGLGMPSRRAWYASVRCSYGLFVIFGGDCHERVDGVFSTAHRAEGETQFCLKVAGERRGRSVRPCSREAAKNSIATNVELLSNSPSGSGAERKPGDIIV